MSGLRKKLSSQGITPAQFGFQFIVVLLGVYLAILFEGKAEDRSREMEARTMLANVLDEMELDRADMARIQGIQADRERAFQYLADLLSVATEAEEPAIDSLFTGPLAGNPTVYPRRAGYSALVESGGLAFISDEEVPILLANLYEHHYPRLTYFGEMYDKTYAENFAFEANRKFWDVPEGEFLQKGKNANRVFRNIAMNQVVMAGMYHSRLSEILAELDAVSEAVQTYVNR